jgi:phenylacetate-coenzyme A ligase PaaK-like adenylate-forming protein
MAAKSGETKKAKQNYWDEKFETMPIAELQKFQLRKLKETVEWAYTRVPFYRRKLDEMGVAPKSIKRSRISPSCPSP